MSTHLLLQRAYMNGGVKSFTSSMEFMKKCEIDKKNYAVANRLEAFKVLKEAYYEQKRSLDNVIGNQIPVWKEAQREQDRIYRSHVEQSEYAHPENMFDEWNEYMEDDEYPAGYFEEGESYP